MLDTTFRMSNVSTEVFLLSFGVLPGNRITKGFQRREMILLESLSDGSVSVHITFYNLDFTNLSVYTLRRKVFLTIYWNTVVRVGPGRLHVSFEHDSLLD